jgi:hypothetical protein
MLSVTIGVVLVALFFFFPVDWVGKMKGFAAKRASQWKGLVGKKGKDGVIVEVDGRKVN